MKRMFVSVVIVGSMLIAASSGLAQQLNSQTQEALRAAINDEYHAKALYQKTIDSFGATRPFVNLVNAEKQHIERLRPLFTKYGVAIPSDNAAGQLPALTTRQEACQIGVTAEKDNAAMYAELLTFVREADIRLVFQQLQKVSLNNHLPALERCASGQGGGRK